MSDPYNSELDDKPTAEVAAPPETDAAKSAQDARALIAVGPGGASPANFAQQVDFAKTMTQARNALPKHLQNNAGDCLAIIDIASRANLSPFMVANKTYIQNQRLCFESQLFHAFAQASGLLRGGLIVDYLGSGDETICRITGFLRGDQNAKIHDSPPLRELHPGFIQKTGDSATFYSYAEGCKLIAEAAEKNETIRNWHAKGSPLWIRKPRVQMFYDTSRDWVRMYCPRAVLGIYAGEELDEYADKLELQQRPRLSARLQEPGPRPAPGEGFRDQAHITSELSRIAPNAMGEFEPDQPEAVIEAEAETVAEPAQPARAARAAEKGRNRNPKPLTKAQTKAIADKAAARSDRARPAARPAGKPKDAPGYVGYAEAWIAASGSAKGAAQRWDSEVELRDRCEVPIRERNRLKALVGKVE